MNYCSVCVVLSASLTPSTSTFVVPITPAIPQGQSLYELRFASNIDHVRVTNLCIKSYHIITCVCISHSFNQSINQLIQLMEVVPSVEYHYFIWRHLQNLSTSGASLYAISKSESIRHDDALKTETVQAYVYIHIHIYGPTCDIVIQNNELTLNRTVLRCQ